MGGTAVPIASWSMVHICSESSHICFVTFAHYHSGTNVMCKGKCTMHSRYKTQQLCRWLTNFGADGLRYTCGEMSGRVDPENADTATYNAKSWPHRAQQQPIERLVFTIDSATMGPCYSSNSTVDSPNSKEMTLDRVCSSISFVAGLTSTVQGLIGESSCRHQTIISGSPSQRETAVAN